MQKNSQNLLVHAFHCLVCFNGSRIPFASSLIHKLVDKAHHLIPLTTCILLVKFHPHELVSLVSQLLPSLF